MYFRKFDNDTYFEHYTIENGDSLYKISKKYNVNPTLLANINGLNMSDYIYPGQVLLVPNQNYSYYITKKGDTVDIVSDMFGISSDKLIKENKTLYLLEGQMVVKKNN